MVVREKPKQKQIGSCEFKVFMIVGRKLALRPRATQLHSCYFKTNPGLNFGNGLWRSSSSLIFRSVSTGRVGSIALAYIFLALKVRLVPASFEDPEFKSSFNQSLSLYTKYQVAIHQDSPIECGKTEVLFLKHFSLY